MLEGYWTKPPSITCKWANQLEASQCLLELFPKQVGSLVKQDVCQEKLSLADTRMRGVGRGFSPPVSDVTKAAGTSESQFGLLRSHVSDLSGASSLS